MKNLPVKYALASALGLLVAMLIVVTLLGMRAQHAAVHSLNQLDEVAARQVAYINRAEINLMEVRVRLARYQEHIQRGEDALAETALNTAREALERADTRIGEFDAIKVDSSSPRAPLASALVSEYSRLINSALRDDLAQGNFAGLTGHRERLNQTFDLGLFMRPA